MNHKQENRILTCGDKFRIVKIDKDNISKIRGRIVPSFSWEDSLHFLENGFGYLALEGEIACAVAFSAAVSTEEVDIGVETREEYRGNGLASVLAGKMCEHITEIGKKPVWAHAASNKASMKTARRCGFVEVKTNTVIR
ncbi:MAG: GNAT family N-acetyltransferase [bacterium]